MKLEELSVEITLSGAVTVKAGVRKEWEEEVILMNKSRKSRHHNDYETWTMTVIGEKSQGWHRYSVIVDNKHAKTDASPYDFPETDEGRILRTMMQTAISIYETNWIVQAQEEADTDDDENAE